MVSSHEQFVPPQALLSDFYQSFLFSQGSAELQLFFYKGLGDYYRENRQIIPDMGNPQLKSAVQKLHSPVRHVAPEVQQQQADPEVYETEWHNFCTNVHSSLTSFLPTEKHYDPKLATVSFIGDTIFVDTRYQERRRSMSKDPYKSYFRQHVLLAEATGRPSFDHIYARSHTAWQEQAADYSKVKHLASVLGRAWEVNHPGESFWPAPHA